MKPIHATMLFMAGLLALFNSPLRAQDKPADKPAEAAPNPAPEPPPPAPSPNDKDPSDDRRNRERDRKGEEKAVSFIGVLTSNVSPELRTQFNLQEGFGLQVIEVMPDTPAATAGLKEHDILLKFDDQKLVNMDQLQTLVRSKKKDDSISFTVISGGKESQLAVKVGERMVPAFQEEGRGRGGRYFQGGSPSFGYGRGGDFRGLNDMQENVERLQSLMRDYQNRMTEWSKDRHGDMPTPPSFDSPRRREGGNSQRYDGRGNSGPRGNDRHDSRRGTISRRDESGEYQLTREDDNTVFTVRPKEGAEQKWNVDNDTERAAVPEQFREKLKMLEDIRKDMRRDGGPGKSDKDQGPKADDRRPAPDGPKDGTPPPAGTPAPRPGGTI